MPDNVIQLNIRNNEPKWKTIFKIETPGNKAHEVQANMNIAFDDLVNSHRLFQAPGDISYYEQSQLIQTILSEFIDENSAKFIKQLDASWGQHFEMALMVVGAISNQGSSNEEEEEKAPKKS